MLMKCLSSFYIYLLKSKKRLSRGDYTSENSVQSPFKKEIVCLFHTKIILKWLYSNSWGTLKNPFSIKKYFQPLLKRTHILRLLTVFNDFKFNPCMYQFKLTANCIEVVFLLSYRFQFHRDHKSLFRFKYEFMA